MHTEDEDGTVCTGIDENQNMNSHSRVVSLTGGSSRLAAKVNSMNIIRAVEEEETSTTAKKPRDGGVPEIGGKKPQIGSL